uniref:Vigilin n=2 Tax=Bursaphelenchus xylophilus TaxID=6326 RepID=A0A1I7SWA4_BURXY
MNTADVFVNGGSSADPASYGFGAPSNGVVEKKPEQPSSSGLPKEKVVMDYSTDFPKLPETKQNAAPAGAWGRKTLTKAVVTETFKLPASDRASMNLGNKGFGLAEQTKCSQVAAETNTKIELSEASDKSLTILISGKKSDVDVAHGRLVRELQTQSQIEVSVDREFYGAIIGKQGDRRKQMENEYNCRIFLPGKDEQSSVIRIVGPIDQIRACGLKLKSIVTELAKQATESLDVPREFYPWIRGPANKTLESIQAETGAKVNIPTSKSKNDTIVIAGEREGVYKALALVKKIYESAKKNNKSVTCKVNRSQHRFIIGNQRSGIDEILEKTGVLVEVPSEEENSDTITLRGPQAALGDALALVFARATSIISLEIEYPEWQRRFLIGPKGQTLQQLVPKQDRLNVEFENGGKIYLEGPPEAVKNAHVALSTEINRLTKEMASETVKIPAYLHRHIIGRSGALINKIKEDNEVQITIPDERQGSDEIRIEGKKEGVKNAVNVLKERGAELEKKMPADKQPPQLPLEETFKTSVDVEPKWHKHFVLRGAEVIREIQDQFGGVVISFPRQDSGESKVHIKGPKASIDQARKKIEEIVADLEAQITVNLEISEEHHRSLVPHANAIRQKHNVRLNFPPRGTSNEGAEPVDGILPANLVTLSGLPSNIEAAKAELVELIPVTEVLTVPTEYHSTLIGKKGESIRAFMQTHNVRVTVPSAEDNSDKVTVTGPPKNVAAAVADLKNKVEELDKQSEDRRLRSYKTVVEIPLEYHQRLIGQGGQTIREFSKKYDVHVAFPRDNTETITISGYEDKANEAKDEIVRLVEEYKNMITHTVQLDPRFHPRLIGPRGKNLKKYQEDFNVEINFATRNDPDPSLVTVSGKNEENILDCIDKLRLLEEDFMQDVVERYQYTYQRRAEPVHQPKPQAVEITGAPWQLDNLDQFPTMGQQQQQAAVASHQPTGYWGRRN